MNLELEHSLIVMLVGVLVAAAILTKWSLAKTFVPPLIGFLGIGFALRLGELATFPLTGNTHIFLDILAEIGVVILLFRVGLESNVHEMLRQFRNAQGVWIGNVLLSGGLAYLTSTYVLELPLIPSLFITVALTATSVAVPVAIWREAHLLESPEGRLLLDVAELDDISAVVLMSLLLAVVPVIQQHADNQLLPVLLQTGGLLLAKLLMFGGVCYVFSRFAERRMTRFFQRIQPTPDPMLMLVATGFVIAALAGLLGFSIGLGAFFAGLIFSRDPEAVKLNRPYIVLYELFTPFFFISIGMQIDPQLIVLAAVPGAVLLVPAMIGKVVGTMAPAVHCIGWSASLALGISMMPRAEIAMVVMRHGQQLEDSAVSDIAFAAVLLVSAATCVLSPLLLRLIFRSLKPTESPARPSAQSR